MPKSKKFVPEILLAQEVSIDAIAKRVLPVSKRKPPYRNDGGKAKGHLIHKQH